MVRTLHTLRSTAGPGLRALARALALLVIATGTAATAAQVDVGDGTVAPGTSVSIPVDFAQGPGDSVSAVSVDIAFDDGQLVDPPVCTIDPAIGAGTAADKTLTQSRPGAGVVRLGVLGLNNNVLPDGALAHCDFTAEPTATPATLVLAATAGASNADGSSAPVTAQPGQIVVAGDGDGIAYDPGLPPCAPGQTQGCSDNCPATANPDQADADLDGVGDACDLCVAVANPSQTDTDADGYGNACDCDFDQDGTCNIADFNTFLSDFSSGSDSGVGSDMDASGSVGIGDFNLFLPGFSAGAPGPSAAAP